MPAPLILDPKTIDCRRIHADAEAIRQVNPHRGQMEMLTAVVSVDSANQIIIGYLDVPMEAFWTAGHFPGMPLLPGVLQCEAAAQLLSYYATIHNVSPGNLLGFGGIENTRFRSPVRPGDRLVIVAKGTRVDRRQTIFHTQGFVGEKLIFEADVMGVPIGKLSDVKSS